MTMPVGAQRMTIARQTEQGFSAALARKVSAWRSPAPRAFKAIDALEVDYFGGA